MHNTLIKRALSLTLSLGLALSLAACGKKGNIEETKLADPSEKTEQVNAATDKAAGPSENSAETAQVPEPEEEEEPDAIVMPLCGKPCEPEERERRVVAVMIDNHPKARFQAGWSQADMVFEYKVEGSFTRYMMLFQSQDAEHVGPIRSARPYFIRRMQEFNSIYTHVGGSIEALDMLKDNKYDEVEGIATPSSVIWRYNASGKYAPHNAYSKTEVLRQYGHDRGYADAKAIRGYRFNLEPAVPAGDDALKVVVRQNANNTSTFDYVESEGTYTFTKDGVQQFDENTKEDGSKQPVSFMNVIIQRVHYYPSAWDAHLWAVAASGSGEGYYVSRGKVVPITWKKESEEAQTLYYTKDGKELKLNPGKTFVSVIDNKNTVDFNKG